MRGCAARTTSICASIGCHGRGCRAGYRWRWWRAKTRNFPYHHGFDFDSIQDAIDAADDGKRLRGASTISQQTAKNLFLWNGRSFVRKGLEAYFTVLIEMHLAEAAHPRGLRQHRRVGRWHLRRRRGQRSVFPHLAGAAGPGAGSAAGRRAAQPAAPACGSPERLCATSRQLDPAPDESARRAGLYRRPRAAEHRAELGPTT